MPRERRKRNQPRPDLATLSPGQIEDLFYRSPQFGFGDDKESYLAAWNQHRQWLFWEFVAEEPGYRPAAWWLARGIERPILNPFLPQSAINERRREFFGFLHTSILGGPGLSLPFQQREPDYLREHNLLKRGELKANHQYESSTGEYADES